ncbi:MAG TPA: DegT/DnrJ/EryC1/StrS family aminotransferase [Candidatus Bathyarchaeia archaeon]|nr:DegT/DnrJ/EryC1/StrS family aminotransferase [Candidatus Bathyarchaeia archaeon]
MSRKEIPPVKPYFPPEDVQTIQKDVEKILNSGMLTLGEYTRRFEEEYAKLCGTKHAVAVNSGTSALEIVLRALGLKPSDEVLVPTNTFSATAAVVVIVGGKPVFTDISAESLCIDAESVQKNLTNKTKAVIAVHIGGLVCPDIKAIREICEDHKILLVEDAAHAQGSLLERKAAGSFGKAGCFSFYPTKVITTGEGGIITTDSSDLAQKAMVLRDQGKENFSSNIIIEIGYNWRMDEISAAIGLTQLHRLPDFIKRRNGIAHYFDKNLANAGGLKPLRIPENAVSNYYKYVAFVAPEIQRDMFKQRLREKGVRPSGEVYWPPLHMEPVYKRLLEVKEGDFPVAEDLCARMVCLPMYSQMTFDEAEYVVEKVKEVLAEI